MSYDPSHARTANWSNVVYSRRRGGTSQLGPPPQQGVNGSQASRQTYGQAFQQSYPPLPRQIYSPRTALPSAGIPTAAAPATSSSSRPRATVPAPAVRQVASWQAQWSQAWGQPRSGRPQWERPQGQEQWEHANRKYMPVVHVPKRRVSYAVPVGTDSEDGDESENEDEEKDFVGAGEGEMVDAGGETVEDLGEKEGKDEGEVQFEENIEHGMEEPEDGDGIGGEMESETNDEVPADDVVDSGVKEDAPVEHHIREVETAVECAAEDGEVDEEPEDAVKEPIDTGETVRKGDEDVEVTSALSSDEDKPSPSVEESKKESYNVLLATEAAIVVAEEVSNMAEDLTEATVSSSLSLQDSASSAGPAAETETQTDGLDGGNLDVPASAIVPGSEEDPIIEVVHERIETADSDLPARDSSVLSLQRPQDPGASIPASDEGSIIEPVDEIIIAAAPDPTLDNTAPSLSPTAESAILPTAPPRPTRLVRKVSFAEPERQEKPSAVKEKSGKKAVSKGSSRTKLKGPAGSVFEKKAKPKQVVVKSLKAAVIDLKAEKRKRKDKRKGKLGDKGAVGHGPRSGVGIDDVGVGEREGAVIEVVEKVDETPPAVPDPPSISETDVNDAKIEEGVSIEERDQDGANLPVEQADAKIEVMEAEAEDADQAVKQSRVSGDGLAGATREADVPAAPVVEVSKVATGESGVEDKEVPGGPATKQPEATVDNSSCHKDVSEDSKTQEVEVGGDSPLDAVEKSQQEPERNGVDGPKEDGETADGASTSEGEAIVDNSEKPETEQDGETNSPRYEQVSGVEQDSAGEAQVDEENGAKRDELEAVVKAKKVKRVDEDTILISEVVDDGEPDVQENDDLKLQDTAVSSTMNRQDELMQAAKSEYLHESVEAHELEAGGAPSMNMPAVDELSKSEIDSTEAPAFAGAVDTPGDSDGTRAKSTSDSTGSFPQPDIASFLEQVESEDEGENSVVSDESTSMPTQVQGDAQSAPETESTAEKDEVEGKAHGESALVDEQVSDAESVVNDLARAKVIARLVEPSSQSAIPADIEAEPVQPLVDRKSAGSEGGREEKEEEEDVEEEGKDDEVEESQPMIVVLQAAPFKVLDDKPSSTESANEDTPASDQDTVSLGSVVKEDQAVQTQSQGVETGAVESSGHVSATDRSTKVVYEEAQEAVTGALKSVETDDSSAFEEPDEGALREKLSEAKLSGEKPSGEELPVEDPATDQPATAKSSPVESATKLSDIERRAEEEPPPALEALTKEQGLGAPEVEAADMPEPSTRAAENHNVCQAAEEPPPDSQAQSSPPGKKTDVQPLEHRTTKDHKRHIPRRSTEATRHDSTRSRPLKYLLFPASSASNDSNKRRSSDIDKKAPPSRTSRRHISRASKMETDRLDEIARELEEKVRQLREQEKAERLREIARELEEKARLLREQEAALAQREERGERKERRKVENKRIAKEVELERQREKECAISKDEKKRKRRKKDREYVDRSARKQDDERSRRRAASAKDNYSGGEVDVIAEREKAREGKTEEKVKRRTPKTEGDDRRRRDGESIRDRDERKTRDSRRHSEGLFSSLKKVLGR